MYALPADPGAVIEADTCVRAFRLSVEDEPVVSRDLSVLPQQKCRYIDVAASVLHVPVEIRRNRFERLHGERHFLSFSDRLVHRERRAFRRWRQRDISRRSRGGLRRWISCGGHISTICTGSSCRHIAGGWGVVPRLHTALIRDVSLVLTVSAGLRISRIGEACILHGAGIRCSLPAVGAGCRLTILTGGVLLSVSAERSGISLLNT